jgi:hypothetical protein
MKKRILLFSIMSFFLSDACVVVGQNLVPNWNMEEAQSGKFPEGNIVYSYRNEMCKFDEDIEGWKIAKFFPNCFCDYNAWVALLTYGFSLTATRIKYCESPDWIDTYFNDDFYDIWFQQLIPRPNRFVRIGQNFYEGTVWTLEKRPIYREGIRATLATKLSANKQYVFRCKLATWNSGIGKVLLSKYGENWNADAGNVKQPIAKYAMDDPKYAVNQFYEWQSLFSVEDGKGGKMDNLVIYAEKGDLAVDDVELYEFCPENLFLENRSCKIPEPTYSAKNIYAGYEVANPPAGSGDVIISKGGEINYKAENEVILKPGFEARRGSEFHAWIGPCGSDSWDIPNPRGMAYDLCSAPPPNNCIKIGGNYSPAYTYSWSPSTGLDNPNSPNPTLCLSVNGMGCRNYTLTVRDKSGKQAGPVYPFTIRYWPANSTNWLEFKNYPGYYEKVDHWYCDLTFPHNTRQIVVIFSQADRIYEIKLNAFRDWIPDCGSGFINYHFDTKDWPGTDWKAYDFYYIGFDYYVFCSDQRVQSHGPQWHPQWGK